MSEENKTEVIQNGSKMPEKTQSIIAYLLGIIGGVLVLFVLPDSTKKTRFDAAQALVLGVIFFIIRNFYSPIVTLLTLGHFSGSYLVSSAITVAYILVSLYAILRVNKGEEVELPVISGLATSLLGSFIDKK